VDRRSSAFDARGFYFRCRSAVKLQAGLRAGSHKREKAADHQDPRRRIRLEYGTASVAVHVDALKPGSRVLLIDDLLPRVAPQRPPGRWRSSSGSAHKSWNFLSHAS